VTILNNTFQGDPDKIAKDLNRILAAHPTNYTVWEDGKIVLTIPKALLKEASADTNITLAVAKITEQVVTNSIVEWRKYTWAGSHRPSFTIIECPEGCAEHGRFVETTTVTRERVAEINGERIELPPIPVAQQVKSFTMSTNRVYLDEGKR
jgi:hypothetical protein